MEDGDARGPYGRKRIENIVIGLVERTYARTYASGEHVVQVTVCTVRRGEQNC